MVCFITIDQNLPILSLSPHYLLYMTNPSPNPSPSPNKKQNLITKGSNLWKWLTTTPISIVFIPLYGVVFYAIPALVNIVSFLDNFNKFKPSSKEGWIVVKVVGFGYTYYPESFFDSIQPWKEHYSLRSSKITTMVYTDALPTLGNLNSGSTTASDVSVLTNSNWEGQRYNYQSEFKKNNSQSFQSFLHSSKD
jgi:hypothetical protein